MTIVSIDLRLDIERSGSELWEFGHLEAEVNTNPGGFCTPLGEKLVHYEREASELCTAFV